MANTFTLEVIKAFKGDCLILHYGDAEGGKTILIDGGAKTTYKSFLKPRLASLAKDGVTPLRMLMVSHIDDDHIKGILDLFNDLKKAKDNGAKEPYKITTLWHNSFDDILGNSQVTSFDATGLASTDSTAFEAGLGKPDGHAVLSSVNQGRKLRDISSPFVFESVGSGGNLVQATYDQDEDTKDLGHGLTFRVIGPSKRELIALQEEWDKKLTEAKKGTASVAELAAYVDKSAYNLSSIVVLAQMDGKRILLTGDARGDHILEGLQKSGLLNEHGEIEVDILKMPHHGSDNNVETDFFRKVRAKHYVFSGDGEHNNPEIATLAMIVEAIGDVPVDLYFTYKLDDRHDFLLRNAPSYRIHYPGPGDVSVSVAL